MSFDIVYSLSYNQRNEVHFLKAIYSYYLNSTNQMTEGRNEVFLFSPQSLLFMTKIRHKTRANPEVLRMVTGAILFTLSA